MLPLYLLTSAKNQPILIELKSNETINGNLINCDSWMNLTLSNCIKIDATGEKFVKYPEIYVRGTQIKYLRMSNEIMDQVKESQQNDQNEKRRSYQNNQQGGRYNNNNNNNNRRNNQQGGRYNNNNNNNSRGGNNNNRGRYNNTNQNQQQPPQASNQVRQTA